MFDAVALGVLILILLYLIIGPIIWAKSKL
jgi:hypothetical protein